MYLSRIKSCVLYFRLLFCKILLLVKGHEKQRYYNNIFIVIQFTRTNTGNRKTFFHLYVYSVLRSLYPQ